MILLSIRSIFSVTHISGYRWVVTGVIFVVMLFNNSVMIVELCSNESELGFTVRK